MGYHTPTGPVWRYFGDLRCMLVAPQLLVLQVAHPVVGAGVEDYSAFRTQSWRRLWETLLSLNTVIYGGERAAEAETARLRALHARFTGTDARGRPYRALDPEAYHWVHATLVMGAVEAHERFGRPFGPALTEAYYREMRGVGRLWGLAERDMPADWAAFRAYYDDMVARRLEPNASVQDLLDVLRHPAKPPVRWVPAALWRPVADALGRGTLLVTAGMLPAPLRERFGLAWTPRQERTLRRFARAVRVGMAVVPPPLRIAHARALAWWNVRRRAGARP
ncbi:oxygenase MpaB family protein [Streptomyces sp. XD-27]|uniref:oxygenase MpaB family protein n=1 Tax=Streptomyces sp. XD-27 TaxID=3062779 RepID=UPI0026F41352|nr:oxygenase MpaB family protein [Streptomyces sp. XD-27]WKX73321.1 oxygenase MpaB family protein [Streptomyces sp. XD-27]